MNRRGFLKALIGLPVLGAVAALPKGEEKSPIEVTDQGEVVITAVKGLRIENGGKVSALRVPPYKEQPALLWPQTTGRSGLLKEAHIHPPPYGVHLTGRSGGQTFYGHRDKIERAENA